MKKRIILAITLVLSVCVFASCAANNMSSSSGSWHSHYDTAEEMMEEADLIITGVMVDSYTELRIDTVCTRNIIEVMEVYSGDIQVGDTIEVLQTGGKYENVTTPAFSEIPLLEYDKEYALVLRLSDPDEQYGQYYLIMGGYQGVMEITKSGCESLSKENAEFAKDLAEAFADLT